MSNRFAISITTILILVSTFQTGCKKTPVNTTIIEFQVPSGTYDSIGYYLTKENLTAYSLWGFERAYIDSTGFLKLELETDNIGWFFVTLFPNKYDRVLGLKSRVFMLIRPGESYKIEYDSTYQWVFKISGDYETAQNLFNVFNHNHGSLQHTWRTNSDTLPEVLLQHLEDSINISVKQFKELYQNGSIDSTFYFTAYNLIKYTQAQAMLDCLSTRIRLLKNPRLSKYHNDVYPLNLSQDEVQKIEESVFDRYPISKKEAGIMPGLGYYMDQYLKHKVRADNLKKHKEGTYLERLDLVNHAEKYLEDALAEMYFAHQFGSVPGRPGPDSLATFLYKEFKRRYPDSHFMPGVIRHIENLTGYYYTAFYPGLNKSQDTNEDIKVEYKTFFSPDTKFIQGKDSITIIDSLLNQFRGKNLFVDFWASWCPPCRYEFKFADSLHYFLKKHNIEMLYISTDEDESKWKNALGQYNLEGYHYRVANSELRKELSELIDFIPTYMIIDSTGNILNYDAERPHTKTLLYNQIKEAFKIQE